VLSWAAVQDIRRHLAAVFGVWLLCHTCTLAFTPISLCIAMSEQAAAPECTCDHSDGSICPMHHRATAKSKTSSTPCSCRSTTDPNTSMIAALLGPVALIVTPAAILTPDQPTSRTVDLLAPLTYTPVIPEPPPPRA
jgi:hypothetical protein